MGFSYFKLGTIISQLGHAKEDKEDKERLEREIVARSGSFGLYRLARKEFAGRMKRAELDHLLVLSSGLSRVRQ